MNKKLIVITAFLLLVLGIGAVSAEDINQTDDDLEIAESDVLSANPQSFSDLMNDIRNGPQTGLNIQKDYKFDSKKDQVFKDGINLITSEKGTYTIEGNNHVIDANNQACIFKFTNGTVYLKNIKLKNSAQSSIILDNCILHTTNVIFENNRDSSEGGAVYALSSNYYSHGDTFKNNYAPRGADVYGLRSIIEIDGSTFTHSNEIGWGMVYAYRSITKVTNSLFANTTSNYAAAIYCERNNLTVYNSGFFNLNAKYTAGAIGLKTTLDAYIEKCSFVNTTSARNGGAVYADINGDGVLRYNDVTVKNTLFENCYSEYGGAMLQLGGRLTIVDSELLTNVAEYCGGAVYVSNTTTLIANSKLNNNKAKILNGGAVYTDDSDTTIASCDIVSNEAGSLGSGVYSDSSKYTIKNTYFSKNTDNVIVSYFDRKGSSLKNNDLGGGKTLLNQESYTSVIDYVGKKIVLKPTAVKETASSSRFDLRDYNLAGTVKDQGSVGSCWAFAATGALESAFLKATGILLDLSENNIQNAATHYGIFGTDTINEAGYSTSGMALFLAWLGTISVTDDTYDELGKISLTKFTENSYHVQDSIIIPKRTSALDNQQLKDALVKYGGLTVHLYGAISNNDYYNKQNHAQYYNGNADGNHFVTLVGWDDNYSKDNFLIKPKGNGAWICKNSWGSEWGESGYFYVSYYDTSFAMGTTSVGYIIKNTDAYVRSYQYDFGRISNYYSEHDGKDLRYVNTYTAVNNELISAVGTYFQKANEKYTITIFVNGKSVYTQSGASTHGGFETIKLNKKIAVNTGQKFSVQIKAKTMPLLEDTRLHFKAGNSVVYHPDNSMEDLAQYEKTASIKVYTFQNKNPTKTPSQNYAKKKKVTVKSNANGKKISIWKNNKLKGSATVTDGEAEFDLDLEPGVYTIITSYEDDDDYYDDEDDYEMVELFELISTIDVDDIVIVAYKSEIPLEIGFVDEMDVELFDENVTYKIDGKVYTGFIDNNEGILTIDVSSLSIGNHTLILENPETLEEVNVTLSVVSRFGGNSNVKMYYADGSAFKVRVYGDDGEPVGANENVVVKLNKKTYNVKTNSKGYAILKIPKSVKPGSYKLTATYAGEVIKNTVKVKQNLKLSKVTVKKSAKKLVIKAVLKNGKTPVKSKKITFKFNGKKYTAKTNKKGVAKITVKPSVLKKLKVGKKVTYKATYLKNTVKQSVKVKG